MKNIKEILSYVLIILVIVLIRCFIVTPVRVDGNSMSPTLKNGEILLLKKFDKSIERFDIVVIKHNNDRLIKRVIGLPGEYIEYKENKLFVNGKFVKENFRHETTDNFELVELIGEYMKIPKDKYLVLGDNRINSLDSRYIGLIDKKKITGSVTTRLFPFDKIGKIK